MTQALHGKARNLAQRLYDAAGVFVEEANCGHGYYEFYTLDDEVWVRFKPSPDWKMFRVEVQDPSEEYCQLEVDLNFDGSMEQVVNRDCIMELDPSMPT